MLKSFICGLAGPTLLPAERDALASMRPCGIILFARNCKSPDQVTRLIADARRAIDAEHSFVLIDQEGGRVQRMRPPHWRALPSARALGRFYEADPEHGREAARAVARLMGRELRDHGISVDCAPVLDLPVEGAHDIIGDRAYGDTVETISLLGREVAEGLMEGGVLPVIKHIPGHGRAGADSHHDLPVVDTDIETLRETDYRPFIALRDLPMAMSAHVLFTALDAARPATLSPVIIGEVIRGEFGYDGLVMTDDLSMKALQGPLEDRAGGAFAAGIDVVLHCNGELDEMLAVAEAAPALAGPSLARFERAQQCLKPPQAFDVARAEALLAEVMAHDGA